jgi:hypothetical protein
MSVYRIGTLSHNALADAGTLTHPQLEAMIGSTLHEAEEPLYITPGVGRISIREADGMQSGVVSTGAQTYAGKKTFTVPPACSVDPSSPYDLATKGYVDTMGEGMSWQKSVKAFHEFTGGNPSPLNAGDRFIAISTYSSFAKDYIYEWNGSAWVETPAASSMSLFVTDPGSPLFPQQCIVYNGTEWVSLGSSLNHQSLIGSGTLTHAQIDSFIDQDVKTNASPVFSVPSVTGYPGWYSLNIGATGVKGGVVRDLLYSSSADMVSNADNPALASFFRCSGGSTPAGFKRWRHLVCGFQGSDHSSSSYAFVVDSVSSNTDQLLNARAIELAAIGGWEGNRGGIVAMPSFSIQNNAIPDEDRNTYSYFNFTPAPNKTSPYGRINYVYYQPSNGNGYILFENTKDSTSSTTGAAVFSGGAGFAKNVYVGKLLRVEDATDSTSSTTGCAVYTGGVGIGKSLNVGSGSYGGIPLRVVSADGYDQIRIAAGSGQDTLIRATESGAMHLCSANGSTLHLNLLPGDISCGPVRTSGPVRNVDTTDSTSKTTGSMVLDGGLGVGKKLYVGGDLRVESTTASNNTTSGAVVVSGGCGIGGAVYTGGIVRITDATASVSPSTGALVVTGGCGVQGSVNIAGLLGSTNNTASTSPTTGAFVIAGGAGVGGALNVGNVVTSAISAAGDAALFTYPNASIGGSVIGIVVGKSAANDEGARLSYKHQSPGTASTYLSLGIIGREGMRIDGLKNAQFFGDVTASGRVTAANMTCSTAPSNNTDVVRFVDIAGLAPAPRITLTDYGFASTGQIPPVLVPVYIDKVGYVTCISHAGHTLTAGDGNDIYLTRSPDKVKYTLPSTHLPAASSVSTVVRVVVNSTGMFKALTIDTNTGYITIGKLTISDPHWASGDTVIVSPWCISYNVYVA